MDQIITIIIIDDNDTVKPIVVLPITESKKRGRPCSAPERHLSDGTYNNKPLDPEYF